MKISKQYLKQTIKEELAKVIEQPQPVSANNKQNKLPYNIGNHPLNEPYFVNKLMKLGYNTKNARELGQGTQGTAYLIKTNKGNKVLKVTEDQSEAKSCATIAGKKTNYLVRVDKVFAFGKTGLYGIVMELLSNNLSQEEEDFWNYVTEELRDSLPSKLTSWKQMQKFLEIHFSKQQQYYGDEEEDYYDEQDDNFSLFIEEAKRYGFAQMVDELYKYGITYFDFHVGNIMHRGNQPVLIDLGHSKPKGNPNIPILEKNK